MAGLTVSVVARPTGPSNLADWLLAHGRHWITTTEVADLLDIPVTHVPPTLSRIRDKRLLFSPTKGAYVPIPPEYRSWGAVPASHFIDPMMRHLRHDYYVSLLSAAETHGFSHQRPQTFQVMTSARLRDRSFGRVKLAFVTSADTARRPATMHNTPTGSMRVATVETTALDLVALPGRCGGLSNVATVLGEMVSARALDPKRLAVAAGVYPSAVVQRTGWLLEFVSEELGRKVQLGALRKVSRLRATPASLDSHGARRGPLNERWNVIVNASVEPDL